MYCSMKYVLLFLHKCFYITFVLRVKQFTFLACRSARSEESRYVCILRNSSAVYIRVFGRVRNRLSLRVFLLENE